MPPRASQDFCGYGDEIQSQEILEVGPGYLKNEETSADPRYSKAVGGHYLEHIIDEIALEGLDGITLQALAIRLEERPNFEMEGFQEVAATTWNQLKLSKSLRFYVLPCNRPDLVKYSWNDYRDDRGNLYEPLHAPDDIYPYFPVEDKAIGIRGSCEHYQTRKDVSNVVRRVPYAQSIELFGNRMIVVAVQLVREKALFGTNSKKHQGLSVVQYCMIERIGRARHKGEVTRGKVSLQIMKISPKVLFYLRKALLETKVVTRQNASVKFESSRCPSLITVFHLPRFYTKIEMQSNLNIRTVLSQLLSSPTRSIPLDPFVSKYGTRMERHFRNVFSELIERTWETDHSTLDNSENGESSAKKPNLRNIRVLRLKGNDTAQQQAVIQKILRGAELADPENQEEEKIKTNTRFAGIKVLRPIQEYNSMSQSAMLLRALVRSGVRGLQVKEMEQISFITPSEVRSTTRYLNRHSFVEQHVVKDLKHKTFAYTLSKFAESKGEINVSLEVPHQKVKSELAKMRLDMDSTEVPGITSQSSQ